MNPKTVYRIHAVDKDFTIRVLSTAYHFSTEDYATEAIRLGQIDIPEWATTLIVVKSTEEEVARFPALE